MIAVTAGPTPSALYAGAPDEFGDEGSTLTIDDFVPADRLRALALVVARLTLVTIGVIAAAGLLAG